MNTFVMAGADQRVLLHHLASYGLADILHTTGVTGLTLTWHNGYPTITADELDSEIVDKTVRTHIEGRKTWTQRLTEADKRGLMSPRITGLKTADDWNTHQAARETILDELTNAHAWTDLRYLAALGEPSYWSFNRRNEPLQDDGASRLEMQPRNRGSEFVGNRLRPLTEKLLARKPGKIAAGLDGSSISDELGGKPDSVSATGLTTPGPVDNALVWCALWGIGQLPLALRREGAARTSGHLGRSRQEWFYVPAWTGPWRPARLRSVLASTQLRAAAAAGLPDIGDDLAARSAATWLRAHGTFGVLRFPIGRFGSDNAPERRALRGEAIPL
jgi:CRISPR-associated protein Csb3